LSSIRNLAAIGCGARCKVPDSQSQHGSIDA
jgi:hypothetical protein